MPTTGNKQMKNMIFKNEQIIFILIGSMLIQAGKGRFSCIMIEEETLTVVAKILILIIIADQALVKNSLNPETGSIIIDKISDLAYLAEVNCPDYPVTRGYYRLALLALEEE